MNFERTLKIRVKVKPNSRSNEVTRIADGSFAVKVTDPPSEGRANEKVIELLAKHFGIPKRNIAMVRGFSSRNKVLELL